MGLRRKMSKMGFEFYVSQMGALLAYRIVYRQP